MFFWRVKDFGGKFLVLGFQICSSFDQLRALLPAPASSVAAMAGVGAGEEEEKPRGERKRGGREASDLAPVREKKLRKVVGDPRRGKRGVAGGKRRGVVVEENVDGRSKKVGSLARFCSWVLLF